jgi:hypothetical protein
MYLAGIIIVICRINVAQMKAPGYIIGFQFLADQSFIKTTRENSFLKNQQWTFGMKPSEIQLLSCTNENPSVYGVQ